MMEPPVNKRTVPNIILSATNPFRPNDAYQRQSLFWVLGLDLLAIRFLQKSTLIIPQAGETTNSLLDEFARLSYNRFMPTSDALAKKLQSQLSALREITRAISGAWSLEETLGLITRKTARVMDVDSCSIYLLEDGAEYLVLKATTGLASQAVGHARLKLGQGLTGYAAKVGKPIAASHASHDPRFKYLPETKETVFQSLLAVPLIARGKAIGALNVQTRAGREYSPDEVELLSIIADVAAGELEKAVLHDEIGGLKEALETRKLVERAKGILMKRHAIGEQEAFGRIQQQARASRKSMREVAEAIILAEGV